MTQSTPYPLVLEPILMSKVWGGRRLAAYGKPLPPDEPIGESWELADLPRTDPGGGGGDAARSVVANGALAGRTLHDAIGLWGEGLLGDARLTDEGGFPLLVKYLDAREPLSIQVHPSPQYAKSHPDARLKTESWFILEAEPGSVIYKGFREGVTADDLRVAIENGTVPELMRAEPAVPGHCHTLPSGTVHALGAGVLVAEVQTPSDTTFRIYDWAGEHGRKGRELHVQEAIGCIRFDAPPAPIRAQASMADDMTSMPSMPLRTGAARRRIAETGFYTIDAVSASCASVPLRDAGDRPLVVMLLKTMGASIASESGAFPEVVLETGRTALIPASCAGDASLRAGPGTGALVVRLA